MCSCEASVTRRRSRPSRVRRAMATSESDAVKRAPEKRRLTRLFGPTDDEATVEQLGRDREDSVRHIVAQENNFRF